MNIQLHKRELQFYLSPDPGQQYLLKEDSVTTSQIVMDTSYFMIAL